MEQLSPITFNVRTMANHLLPYAVHVNRFKPYVDPLARPLDPPIDLPDDTNDILSESGFLLDSFEAAPLKAPPPGHALEQQQLHSPIAKAKDKTQANALAEDDTLYEIEKILKTRTRNGVKESYVKWKDYSSNHNSRITSDSIVGQHLNQEKARVSQVNFVSF